jgi:hypothetical protein
VRELARVLSPGGTLVLTVDNRRNVTDALLRLATALGQVPFPLGHAPRLDELVAMTRAAGLYPRERTYLVPAPRVIATLAVRAARLLPAPRGERGVQALLRRFEALGRRWPIQLGCFLAIRATRI